MLIVADIDLIWTFHLLGAQFDQEMRVQFMCVRVSAEKFSHKIEFETSRTTAVSYYSN